MFISHLKRILNNPMKIFILILLMLLPTMEVIQLVYQLKDLELTRSIYTLFFLSGAGRGHLFQVIYLWLLPLYLLITIGDDSCTDEKIGYKYMLMSRVGRKKYLQEKWKSSFFIASVLMFIALLCNVIFVYIAFHTRCSDIYLLENMEGTTEALQDIYMKLPLLSYFVYIVLASFISGLLGMLGAIVSTTFRDKKYSYAITFLVWLIFIVMDDSIMLVLQPYIEYPLNTLLSILSKFILVCCLSLAGAVIYEKKRVCE